MSMKCWEFIGNIADLVTLTYFPVLDLTSSLDTHIWQITLNSTTGNTFLKASVCNYWQCSFQKIRCSEDRVEQRAEHLCLTTSPLSPSLAHIDKCITCHIRPGTVGQKDQKGDTDRKQFNVTVSLRHKHTDTHTAPLPPHTCMFIS